MSCKQTMQSAISRFSTLTSVTSVMCKPVLQNVHVHVHVVSVYADLRVDTRTRRLPANGTRTCSQHYSAACDSVKIGMQAMVDDYNVASKA